MSKKPMFVQLEAGAFLSDPAFIAMTPAERGIYCTIIFFLYQNDGRIENNPALIQKLCNLNESFEINRSPLKRCFYVRGKFLRHRRVDLELKKAKERIQVAFESGLKGAVRRWGGHSNPNGNPMSQGHRDPIAKERKGKGREINTSNSKGNARLASNSFRFDDALRLLIIPKNQSDKTSFRNLGIWLNEKVLSGQFNEEIYKRVLDYAKEASGTARHPISMFFSILKREIGYDTKRLRKRK